PSWSAGGVLRPQKNIGRGYACTYDLHHGVTPQHDELVRASLLPAPDGPPFLSSLCREQLPAEGGGARDRVSRRHREAQRDEVAARALLEPAALVEVAAAAARARHHSVGVEDRLALVAADLR